HRHRPPLALPSLPTRRSSDLPGSHHQMRLPAKLEDHFSFEFTKRSLTLPGKDLGDRHPRPGFDERVGIHVDEVELLGELLSYGRFARAHKTHQREVEQRSEEHTSE